MLKKLTLALTLTFAFAGVAFAEVHEVRMLNRSDDARMAFEPAFLRIAEGDTVKFIAEDRGHNAESVDGMMPDGAPSFAGGINEEIEVTLDVAGLYGIKCKPHFAMGMVMTIAVGDVTAAPDTFFEGRLSRKALARFEEQVGNL
jgi:pseudoazurin